MHSFVVDKNSIEKKVTSRDTVTLFTLPKLNINLASFQIKAINYPSENHRFVRFSVRDSIDVYPF